MTKFGTFPTPETRRSSTPRTVEEAMAWEPDIAVQESPEFCAQKIEELDTLLTSMESNHDLESIRGITRFASRDERKASIREAAVIEMDPIARLVMFLETQHTVSKEALKPLQRRYLILYNTIIGVVRNSPDGNGEVVLHPNVREDGTIERD